MNRDERSHEWIEFRGNDGTTLRISKEGGLPMNDILGKTWTQLGIRAEVSIQIFGPFDED
jgi:hypothetical protein